MPRPLAFRGNLRPDVASWRVSFAWTPLPASCRACSRVPPTTRCPPRRAPRPRRPERERAGPHRPGAGRCRPEAGGSFELASRRRSTFELDLAGNEIAVTPSLSAPCGWPGRRAASGAEAATLRAATVTWRDDQVRRLRAELAVEPERRVDLRRLEATLPGQTALAWTARARGPTTRPRCGVRSRCRLVRAAPAAAVARRRSRRPSRRRAEHPRPRRERGARPRARCPQRPQRPPRRDAAHGLPGGRHRSPTTARPCAGADRVNGALPRPRT